MKKAFVTGNADAGRYGRRCQQQTVRIAGCRRQAVSASQVDNVVECMLLATGGLNRNLTLNR
jgi:hypothetical protein